MTEVLQRLIRWGGDPRSALYRLAGDRELYWKLLCRYSEEKEWEEVPRQLEQGDIVKAFRGTHTLKGVAANLGLLPLYDLLSFLTELLREQEEDQIKVKEIIREASLEWKALLLEKRQFDLCLSGGAA